MGTLTGKTAVVTGSTSGIGLAYARTFASAGANAASVISSDVFTGQAQRPSGRHSSEPRCDMPAKRKPPSP